MRQQARHRLGAIAALSLVVVASIIPPVLSGNGQAANSIERMKAAWLARQQRFSSVEFKYTTQSHVVDQSALTREVTEKKADALTLTYVDYSDSSTVLISGGNVRYYVKGERPRPEGGLYRHESVDASNAKTSKHLDTSNIVAYSTGQEYKDPVNQFVYLGDTLPIRWAFFGPSRQFYEFDVDTMTIDGQGAVEGRKCILAKAKSLTPRLEEHYWIDPSRDYSIVRYTAETEDKTRFQLECTHKLDSKGVWIPAKWVVTRLAPNGSILSLATNELKDCRFDVAVSAEDFDIQFPAGTVVTDGTTRPARGRSLTSHYLVMPDGSKRVMTPEEHAATYEQLLATPSGQAVNLSAKQPGFSWFMAVNSMLFVVLVGLFVYRWWLIRRRVR